VNPLKNSFEALAFFHGYNNLPVDPLDMNTTLHPTFLLQGTIMNNNGDALNHLNQM